MGKARGQGKGLVSALPDALRPDALRDCSARLLLPPCPALRCPVPFALLKSNASATRAAHGPATDSRPLPIAHLRRRIPPYAKAQASLTERGRVLFRTVCNGCAEDGG